MKKYRLRKTDLNLLAAAKELGLTAHICNEHGPFALRGNSNDNNKCPKCGKECDVYKPKECGNKL